MRFNRWLPDAYWKSNDQPPATPRDTLPCDTSSSRCLKPRSRTPAGAASVSGAHDCGFHEVGWNSKCAIRPTRLCATGFSTPAKSRSDATGAPRVLPTTSGAACPWLMSPYDIGWMPAISVSAVADTSNSVRR